MRQGTDMDGVGRALLTELERECTAGDAGQYVRARVEALLDEMAEFPDAHQAMSRAYARTRAVNERRKRMAVAE